MTYELPAPIEQAVHATLVFDREISANVEKVFAAFSDAKTRARWSAPSDTAIVIYDQENFRQDGEDRFRCGSKINPNINGTTRYLKIIPNQRIVSTETLVMDGKQLCVSLTTLDLTPYGRNTKLKSTIQVVSFIGDDMIRGHEQGNNSSLDNLVKYFPRISPNINIEKSSANV